MATMEFKQRTLMQIANMICGNFKNEESFFRYCVSRGLEGGDVCWSYSQLLIILVPMSVIRKSKNLGDLHLAFVWVFVQAWLDNFSEECAHVVVSQSSEFESSRKCAAKNALSSVCRCISPFFLSFHSLRRTGEVLCRRCSMQSPHLCLQCECQSGT
jgi:hypothetical protein